MISKFTKAISTFLRKILRNLRAIFITAIVLGTAVSLVLSTSSSEPAYAGTTIRSASSDGCTVDVGNSSVVTITKNGNICVVTTKGNTTVGLPSYVTSIGVIAVGGGGGGGSDGGAGGGGGEIRYAASEGIAAGSTLTIQVGTGGRGGSWSGGNGADSGTATSITVASTAWNYTARGGNGGGGWGSGSQTPSPAGGSGGQGGIGIAGGKGGYGPGICTPLTWGGTGENGGQVSTVPGVAATYFGGGGGGGNGNNTENNSAYYGLGPLGGAGGGGQGSNARYAVDNTTWIDGASPGHDATANTGGGGGGGSACNARGPMNLGYDGVSQRTPGGRGADGIAILTFTENLLTVATAADGCVANLAEACLQAPVIQLKDTANANVATSGVSITVTSSPGTANGNTATTDANGKATFSNLYITGSSAGTTITLTFEAVGWRNIQTTFVLKAYADKLSVVSGSTDTTGGFIGTTGVWMATSTNSSISVTTLNAELANRDVILRAHSATISGTNGLVEFQNGAVVNPNASAARTLYVRASENIDVLAGSKITSTTNPLNVILNSNYDQGANGGVVYVASNGTDYAIDTKGGHFATGYGYQSTSWTGTGLNRPNGNSYGLPGSNVRNYGVEFTSPIANGLMLRTGGGKVNIVAGVTSPGTAGYNEARALSITNSTFDIGTGTFVVDAFTSGNMSAGTKYSSSVGIDSSTINAGDITIWGSNSATTGINQLVHSTGTVTLNAGSAGTVYMSANSSGQSITVDSPYVVTGNLTFNGAMTGKNIVINSAVSATGNISAQSPAISIAANLSTSGAAKTITLKSTTDILHTAGTVSSQGGAITYWSDTDTATAAGGGVQIGASAAVNSNGGAITISGGEATSSGFAIGTTATTFHGAFIQGSVAAAGGNILIRGQDSSSPTTDASTYAAGVQVSRTASITTTGSGTLTMLGKTIATDNTKWHDGVILGVLGDSGTATISTQTGAISITGDTAGTDYTNRISLGFYYVNISSSTGAQTYTANGAATNSAQLNFDATQPASISSTGGAAITAIGSNSATDNLQGATISSSGAITIQTNKPTFAASYPFTLAGTGAKVIESVSGSSSFGLTTVTTSGLATSGSASLRIGKSTNTSAITIGASLSNEGPINVYGGLITQSAAVTATGSTGSVSYEASSGIDITGGISAVTGISLTNTGATTDIVNKVGSNLVVSGLNAGIFMKSARNVDLGAKGMTYTTNKGDIVLWADSDADDTNGGSVWVGATSVMNTVNGDLTRTSSGGGDIIIGGGSSGTTSPTGYLGFRATGTGVCGFESGTGSSTTQTTKFYTGGGDFRVKAKGYISSDAVCFTGATTLWANSGQIDIDQQSTAGNGLQIARGTPTAVTEFFSSSDTAPAIKLSAQTTNTFGLLIGYNSAGPNQNYLQASGAGGISLSGKATSPSSTWAEVGIGATNILSAGPITVTTSSNTSGSGGLQLALLGNAGTGATQNIFGYCATTTCPDSKVTSASPTITINSNVIERTAARFYTTFNTAGTVKNSTHGDYGICAVQHRRFRRLSDFHGLRGFDNR